MAYELLEEKALKELGRLAEQGVQSAQEMLLNELRRVAKTANTRLLRIEKQGFENQSNAYGRAVYYTQEFYDSTRFRANTKMDVQDIMDEYREIRTFLRKESSTIRGIKAAKSRFFKSLSAYDINIPTTDRDSFYEFVNSDNVQDVLTYLPYDTVLDAISNNIDRLREDFEGLQREFLAYLTGEIEYDSLLKRIKGGEDIEELYKRHRDRGTALDKRRGRYRRSSR